MQEIERFVNNEEEFKETMKKVIEERFREKFKERYQTILEKSTVGYNSIIKYEILCNFNENPMVGYIFMENLAVGYNFTERLAVGYNFIANLGGFV